MRYLTKSISILALGASLAFVAPVAQANAQDELQTDFSNVMISAQSSYLCFVRIDFLATTDQFNFIDRNVFSGKIEDKDGNLGSIAPYHYNNQSFQPNVWSPASLNVPLRSSPFPQGPLYISVNEIEVNFFGGISDFGEEGRFIIDPQIFLDAGGTCTAYANYSLNTPPVAVTGPDIYNGIPNSTITLNGTASYDDDNDPLTYRWTQVAGPTVTLSDPTVASPTFIFPPGPAATVYTFELIVNDGTVDSDPVYVSVFHNGRSNGNGKNK